MESLKSTRRLSDVNGMATKLSKKLTKNTVRFILEKAGTMSAQSIANIIHRPLSTVRTVAQRNGVSLKLSEGAKNNKR
jgi:hypothetical protein